MATNGLKIQSINPSDLLILMALPQESQGYVEKWVHDHQSQVVFIGVGLISAAVKTDRAIREFKPKHVLNLGTAGSLNFQIGSMVECTEILRRDSVLAFLSRKLSFDSVTKLPATSCGSADFIDTSDEARKYGVLDMEAFAIATVCSELRVPSTFIKFVTDESSTNAKQDWQKNLSKAAKAFYEFLNSLKSHTV